ncbi:DUF6578 domain-containing protein [Streptomyces sp. NRRL S-337]|uniref:DUF6578 domain-containing protein n=1 Tax=Streptomyces sp. NRRL S-337 TaxID=1463900 RepID=UPI0004CC3E5E|nr:DUF6578 domain-containing protein [Streptomyces sp. NRRL S-337]
MNTRVWMDSWQMGCCGEPFTIGSEVSWTVVDPDREWLTKVLGARTAATVDGVEEHHGGRPEQPAPVRGTVTGIHAVHCRFAALPGEPGHTRGPVPGSGTLTALSSAPRWTSGRDGLDFVGFLVDVAAPPR